MRHLSLPPPLQAIFKRKIENRQIFTLSLCAFHLFLASLRSLCVGRIGGFTDFRGHFQCPRPLMQNLPPSVHRLYGVIFPRGSLSSTFNFPDHVCAPGSIHVPLSLSVHGALPSCSGQKVSGVEMDGWVCFTRAAYRHSAQLGKLSGELLKFIFTSPNQYRLSEKKQRERILSKAACKH